MYLWFPPPPYASFKLSTHAHGKVEEEKSSWLYKINIYLNN